MQNITLTLYCFEELTDQAKQKAIYDNYHYNVSDNDWYQYIYEDANNVGLEINSFNLYRKNIHIECRNLEYTASKIVEYFNKESIIYKESLMFINDMRNLDYDFDHEEIEDKEYDYKNDLDTFYLQLLDMEYDYLTQESTVIEILNSLGNVFLKDGSIFNN